MSLRARLVIGLLALATVGLIALAGITYVEQRNFLYKRVDAQARAAARIPGPRDGGRFFNGGAGGSGRLPDPGPGDGDGHGARGLTRGTWIGVRAGHGAATGGRGGVRRADGTPTGGCAGSCYSSTTPRPALPGTLPADGLLTVKDTTSSTRYRV